MYAHIITNRLGNSDETNSEIAWALESGNVISDQTARTIASWWHSPSQNAMVALSHGMPFNTEDLATEIHSEIDDLADSGVMADWLVCLEATLED